MFFISSQKFSLLLEYLNFFPDVFGQVEKRNDNKAKMSFRIYDVTNRSTNNYNKHIGRSLKKLKQPDNEIWSVNKREK